jgi:radical SAM superfamily enzyme YgiQ (UPF0313 family)
MYIAAVVEREGYNVKIIDDYLEKLSQINLSKRILQYKPDIVGISIACTNFYEGLRVAKLIKTISDAFVVIGGPHATLRAKSFIEYPEVDAVVLGEGEYTLLEIIKRIEMDQSLEGCKGCYCKVNGKVIYNDLRERIKDLDSLPLPARHLVRNKSYPRTYSFGGIKRPVDTVSTSRGCPYNCTFCSSREIWGPLYRYRSAEDVVDEIELLIKKYGTRGIYFREDNFTLNKKRVINLCDELIKRNMKIEWECSSRVDLVDKELLKKMREAGCKFIWYGFESGSPKTLEIISKGITVEKSRKAAKITKEAGIGIGGSFMIGIPGETKKDVIKTYNFIKELALTRVSLAHFLGVPDCQLYREIIKNKWYDSCDGEFFFVKLPNLSKEFLNEINIRLKRELPIIRNMPNSDTSPISYLKKIPIALRNLKKTISYIKNYVIYKI